MRSYKIIAVTLMFMCATGKADDDHDSQLTSVATDLEKLHRVTREPHPMADSTVALCRPPTDVPHNIHEGFHEAAYCHVYVNEAGKRTILSGRGAYPVGSQILKSKFRSIDKPAIEVLTVMTKRPAGYDSTHGDWEYAVVDGRSRRVVASGRIDSCIACHADYADTDYVTRAYMLPGDEQPHALERANAPDSSGESTPHAP